jgi:phosphoribosylformimino-5-aminoimidazole carboxamide ribotide isomerase
LVDLEGAKSGEGQNRTVIRQVIKACRVPVQVGGGIRHQADVEELLGWGADFLILGTAALEYPAQVEKWISRWGHEHFIVSLDLKDGKLQTEGWLKQSSRGLREVLQLIRDWNLKEVICTDTERDGTLAQPNYVTYQDLVGLLPSAASLFAAGGVSSPQHIHKLGSLGVQGAIVGRAMYEGTFSWEEWLSAGQEDHSLS